MVTISTQETDSGVELIIMSDKKEVSRHTFKDDDSALQAILAIDAYGKAVDEMHETLRKQIANGEVS